ncbi:hypothetical protein BDZ89DRAFT_1055521 [Hymenopellis radicata]|nr:hypothetical protein BDZ89DRAFT_1055521 [Hymenopellis radicata]
MGVVVVTVCWRRRHASIDAPQASRGSFSVVVVSARFYAEHMYVAMGPLYEGLKPPRDQTEDEPSSVSPRLRLALADELLDVHSAVGAFLGEDHHKSEHQPFMTVPGRHILLFMQTKPSLDPREEPVPLVESAHCAIKVHVNKMLDEKQDKVQSVLDEEQIG